jgi:hypothetical protein
MRNFAVAQSGTTTRKSVPAPHISTGFEEVKSGDLGVENRRIRGTEAIP